jgi:hypothetical protein
VGCCGRLITVGLRSGRVEEHPVVLVAEIQEGEVHFAYSPASFSARSLTALASMSFLAVL